MIDMRVSFSSNNNNNSRFSMAGVTAVFVTLLLIFSALPVPAHCGEDNDPDWYSRSAEMINAKSPEDIYTRGHGHAYLGIPYAMPSNGTNAFELPQDIDAHVYYTNQVNLDFGPYCPQMVEVPGMPDRNFFIGQQDCLTLNVIHPLPPNATRKYPVYVVLHPGWLIRGTARDFGIQGIVHNLVARGIVVVTVEYRLGTYGLFNFGTGAEGNSLRSIYDVIAALQWVYEHIHNFAGNKSAVTLGGWGDGGACLVSWLVIAATNTSNKLSDLFQQADVHGGNKELCWLHFYSDAGRDAKVGNTSQAIAKELLCASDSITERRKCMEQKCACTRDDSKEVCETKTSNCTEVSLKAARKLYLPVAQMEEPDGAMFTFPPSSQNYRNAYMKDRHTMRIMHSWTRDEWASIPTSTPVSSSTRYDKEYLQAEFFCLTHLKPTVDNNVTAEFDAMLKTYLSLYKLDDATMSESDWYRLYIRFMSDYLFPSIAYADGFTWDFNRHTVFFYQFDAQPFASLSFTPVVDPSAAKKFNASMVGHLADLPYVFMAEQYFKPGEHNIAGALDKLPVLAEWPLADVMGRMMADFVWQRPMVPYFRSLERCFRFPGDTRIFSVPWVTRISRGKGIVIPTEASMPIDNDLAKSWSRFLGVFFSGGQNKDLDPSDIHIPPPPTKELICPRLDASNLTEGL